MKKSIFALLLTLTLASFTSVKAMPFELAYDDGGGGSTRPADVEVVHSNETDYSILNGYLVRKEVTKVYDVKEYFYANEVNEFGGSCPTNWTVEFVLYGDYDENGYLLHICRNTVSGYYVTNSEPITESTVTYHSRPTYSNDDWVVFTYEATGKDVTMGIFEGSILWMTRDGDNYSMTREKHYERNDYNYNFASTYMEFLWNPVYAGCYPSPGVYFHEFADYDGDTTNQNYGKYLCPFTGNTNTSYEVIYNKTTGIKVYNVKNAGTFNYHDTLKSGLTDHYMYDVLPYLVWGNHQYDATSALERFYIDYTGSSSTHRGTNLYSAGTFNSGLTITDIQLIMNHNNEYYNYSN